MFGMKFYWEGAEWFRLGWCGESKSNVVPLRPPPSFCSVCGQRAPGGLAGQTHGIKTLDAMEDGCSGIYQLRPKLRPVPPANDLYKEGYARPKWPSRLG